MPIPVTDLFKRIDDLLLDCDRVRWTEVERLRWANEAMGAIMSRRPQAFARREVVTLAAGAAQTIPVGGSMLLDVVRNMGANGATPGRAIRRTSRQVLDDGNRDWYSETPVSTIKNFTFDERLPAGFYVYPPATDGTQVEIVYTKLPPTVTDVVDGELDIGGEYLEPMLNYICYRCHSKDAEYADNGVAVAYFQAFEQSLGIKNQSETVSSPNERVNRI